MGSNGKGTSRRPSASQKRGSSGSRKDSGTRSTHKQSTGRKSTNKSRSSKKGARSGQLSDDKRSSDRRQSAKKKQYSATTRSVEAKRREEAPKRRRDLQGAAVNLPNWVIENLARVTPKDRVGPALEALGAASEALADGKYQSAVKHGQRAKALAPNDPTIRETIGVAAYRVGDWSTALNELRAYRRMAGETTHLPIEMDVLRAMGRNRDVETAWKELQKRGGHGLVMNEGTVVYASYLLDNDRASEAWEIANPGRIVAEPNDAHLRLYFVAARAAAALGDRHTAKQLANTIVMADPGFPGWDQLEAEISQIPN